MRATIVDRFFGDQPTHDTATRVGRIMGTIIGLALYPMFVWIVLDGLFRIL